MDEHSEWHVLLSATEPIAVAVGLRNSKAVVLGGGGGGASMWLPWSWEWITIATAHSESWEWITIATAHSGSWEWITKNDNVLTTSHEEVVYKHEVKEPT